MREQIALSGAGPPPVTTRNCANVPRESWHISNAADNSVWVGKRSVFEFQKKDMAGNTLAVIARNAAWFPNRAADSLTDARAVKPLPVVSSISELPDGKLAVLLSVPARQWKRTATVQSFCDEVVPVFSTDDLGNYEKLLELIDPVAGRVVASTYLPVFLSGYVGAGLFSSVAQDSDGFTYIDIWKLVVTER